MSRGRTIGFDYPIIYQNHVLVEAQVRYVLGWLCRCHYVLQVTVSFYLLIQKAPVLPV